MNELYDYHVELQMPDGYKDEWSGVSKSRETALQVSSMIDHRGANATQNFTATLKIYGNTYDKPKSALVKELNIRVNAGFNAKNNSARKLVLGVFSNA